MSTWRVTTFNKYWWLKSDYFRAFYFQYNSGFLVTEISIGYFQPEEYFSYLKSGLPEEWLNFGMHNCQLKSEYFYGHCRGSAAWIVEIFKFNFFAWRVSTILYNWRVSIFKRFFSYLNFAWRVGLLHFQLFQRIWRSMYVHTTWFMILLSMEKFWEFWHFGGNPGIRTKNVPGHTYGGGTGKVPNGWIQLIPCLTCLVLGWSSPGRARPENRREFTSGWRSTPEADPPRQGLGGAPPMADFSA